jgi:RNA polymerase sigma-70 factor (ECF subfamily)
MAQDLFDKDKYSEDAFDTIFKRYYEGLLSFAKVLIPYPTDEAEDIVAEIFCTMWLNRKQISITNTLGAYLYTAVKNRVFDYYRKRKIIFHIPEEDNASADHQQPDHLLMYKDATQRIRHLINELPPQMRLVFQLNRYEGFSYEEIAGLLDISVNSVKTHMFRALKSLKASYPMLPNR